jgi:DNA mismatch repair protein MSH5
MTSYVPAQSAIIGIIDKILTRVQTRESVSKVHLFEGLGRY